MNVSMHHVCMYVCVRARAAHTLVSGHFMMSMTMMR